MFGWAQYSAFCEPASNLEPAKPRETGLSPCFCWFFPSVGQSAILGLLFWLCCMPVAGQAQAAIICFVKVETMSYARSVPCSGPWETSRDTRAPIGDDAGFDRGVAVKQLSLLLGTFSVATVPDRGPDMTLMKYQDMRCWMKAITESAFPTWTQIVCSAKAMYFFSLVPFEYYRLHELIRKILGTVGGDMRGCLCSAGTQNAL